MRATMGGCRRLQAAAGGGASSAAWHGPPIVRLLQTLATHKRSGPRIAVTLTAAAARSRCVPKTARLALERVGPFGSG